MNRHCFQSSQVKQDVSEAERRQRRGDFGGLKQDDVRERAAAPKTE